MLFFQQRLWLCQESQETLLVIGLVQKADTICTTKKIVFGSKKYLVQSKDFFEKYGGKAIIFARFLPIFRTFAPIVAGIVSMERKKFMFYNILSSFIWSYTLIFAGHYLYGFLLDNYQIDLKQHIELIVLILVGITILPVIYKFGKKTKEEVQINYRTHKKTVSISRDGFFMRFFERIYLMNYCEFFTATIL